jgi:hypothetical protein
MLAAIPHHTEGFKPGRLCECGKNRNGIHEVTHFHALMRIPAYKRSFMGYARP